MRNESDIQHFAAIGQESMDYATDAAVPGRYVADIIPASQCHSLILASSVS